MGARALRIRIAAYYESLDLRAFDLQAIAAAGSTIGRVAQFADDSLQSALGDRRVKILPALDDVIAVAHRPLAKDQFAQKILALFQRDRSSVETIEREQVEDVVADRHREAESRYLSRVVHMHPALQQLKARTATIVLRDDFAVENKSFVGKRIQSQHDFRIPRRNLGSTPCVKPSAIAVANR